ncbi:MAG TPA: MBL fold metallo-hydrolase [Firmicutes bacterium]|jgi:7,8-dihydropterin-6-yl-methyl-4-(beta-D-ribofuranosyl)aminobenzene 5'-phosphate synthase|nr:MBL fold metallo-hydrolase [Bacillota bacterium]
MPKIKITTLCENSSPGFGLVPEHGLSMLLETGGKKYLFDTGTGAGLTTNARLLDVDLATIDAVIFSHGHLDHTGGLEDLLEIRGSLPVYAHPDIFNNYLGSIMDGNPSYVGPPWTNEYLQKMNIDFIHTDSPLELEKGIMITGPIPRITPYEEQEPQFLRKEGQGFVHDQIYDDQALVIESSGGIVVLLGCTHAGLINTLSYIVDLTGKSKIKAVIGGTHLMNASDNRLASTIKDLRKFDIDKLGPCHCTGFRATAALHQAFPQQFIINQVSSVFEFD